MNILEKFPDSVMINMLLQKLEYTCDDYSDLNNEVSRFRTYVIQELRQINELFNEYTPHDEDYHITNMFRISDILLGEERYSKMNVIEIFLLIVSMYAHDWGMAVSKSERYYIATKKMQIGSPKINLLEDENDRFEQFIQSKLGKIKFNNDEEIGIGIWQDYIRNTHAIRSGKRVYSYFCNFNSSFAGALEKICVGHWLEIEDICDHNGYYKDTSVLGENVNLKALSLYIRLIDLFDLSEDRTPYVIWKYVNPQNSFSKMEWYKHRALHQITCPAYEGGRVICISGSTDNHDVYAALMDFKKICEKYFRECVDAMAHMNDLRHQLGVHLLDWRIEARNFKPIDINFSFDNEHIFNILGNEIYNCHPYIYIREIIQNSIDAITLRKSILDRKKVGGDNIGYIYIDVSQISDEEVLMVCRDDGVGMDEYIIKNYFSVLGKSYYMSDDFKNKALDFSPISKFGIGILSCFSVASKMVVTSRREPYMEEGRTALKTTINDLRKTFRVEEIPEFKFDVGTEIQLYIKKENIMKQLEKKQLTEYNITNYVKHIVNYLEYPIIINENNLKTIICPLNFDIEKVKKEVSDIKEYIVYREKNEYPIQEVVFEQDKSNFEYVFDICNIDLKNDLEISEIEGKIHFAILKDYEIEIKNETHCWPTDQVIASENLRIRWKNTFSYFNKKGLMDKDWIMLYNKGILVEHDENKYYHDKLNLRTDLFPTPYISINFTKTISDISVSRFSGISTKEFINELWDILNEKMIIRIGKELDGIEHYEFWRKLTVNVMQFRLDMTNLPYDFYDNLEVPYINEKGKLLYEKIHNIDSFLLIPNKRKDILIQYGKTGKYIDEATWTFGKCLLAGEDTRYMVDSISSAICTTIKKVIRNKFGLKKMYFVYDTLNEKIIEQEMWEKGDGSNFICTIKNILTDFGIFAYDSEDRLEKFCDGIKKNKQIVAFSEEYNSFMAYKNSILNIDNDKIQLLIVYYWLLDDALEKQKKDKLLTEIEKDKLYDLPISLVNNNIIEKEYLFSEVNKSLRELHSWLKALYPNLKGNVVTFSKDDFIESTIELIDEDTFKLCKES